MEKLQSILKKRRGRRPYGDDRKGKQRPEDSQKAQIHNLIHKCKETVFRVKDSIDVHVVQSFLYIPAKKQPDKIPVYHFLPAYVTIDVLFIH